MEILHRPSWSVQGGDIKYIRCGSFPNTLVTEALACGFGTDKAGVLVAVLKYRGGAGVQLGELWGQDMLLDH
jgi:hypothetical protein